MLEVCRIPARWWLFSLAGLVLLALGVLCIVWTGQVLSILLILFSAITLILGILLLGMSILSVRFGIPWAPLALGGIFFLITGIVSVFFPAFVSIAAVFLVAAISLLFGVLLILYGAISFAEAKTRALLVILGIIPIVIGLYMILNPGAAGALVLILWGIFACILGVILVVQALVLRQVQFGLGCDE